MTATAAHALPVAPGIDHSLALLREGYTFVGSRCQALASDAFRARLLMRPVVCMRGPEAALLFYGGAPLTRRGGTPKSALHLLQDEGSVQTLDGDQHRRRKSLFMSLAEEASLSTLITCFDDALEVALADWERGGDVVLHSALAPVLTRAAADFCGIPGDRNLSRDLFQMIESAGSIGPANWLARLHRRQRERWAARVVDRSRSAPGDGGSFLERLAAMRGNDGEILPPEVAAVELLNVLRPIVAIGRFIVFGALALHRHPEWRDALRQGGAEAETFCAEVRRYYPFFPAVGARARDAFTALGHDFQPGDWLLLDLYGTNRHPDAWENAEAFRPERFARSPWPETPLVAQGGGDWRTTHRCPGEHATMALMKRALRRLASVDYTVPTQDLTVDLSHMPALPKSGFVMSHVRRQ